MDVVDLRAARRRLVRSEGVIGLPLMDGRPTFVSLGSFVSVWSFVSSWSFVSGGFVSLFVSGLDAGRLSGVAQGGVCAAAVLGLVRLKVGGFLRK